MAADDVDFVTVTPATAPRRACAALMKYQAANDEYVMAKCSVSMPVVAAERVARAWAAALRLEFRP